LFSHKRHYFLTKISFFSDPSHSVIAVIPRTLNYINALIMNTVTQHRTHQNTSIQRVNTSALERFIAYGEENRFGVICFALLIVGCLGGITMMYGAAHYTGMLIAVVVPTMLTLSLLLAVAPMRLIYLAFGLAVITDLFVLLGLSL
jgi:hypothetical protein